MLLPAPLVEGVLVARRQRFFADVRLADGRLVTAHCPNTGSMLGLTRPGMPVWLARASEPRRKLPYTWELAEPEPGVLVGVNTARANRVVEEALRVGRVAELAGYELLRREARFGREGSRVDFLLKDSGGGDCFVEVKSVTAAVDAGVGLFPDAVTARGAKHLRELVHAKGLGARAVVLFCAQRADVAEVRPADHIDPAYGALLREAYAKGVELYAYACRVSTREITLDRPVPVIL